MQNRMGASLTGVTESQVIRGLWGRGSWYFGVMERGVAELLVLEGHISLGC